MPWLDKLLHKNPLVGFFSKQKASSPVLKFALERIAERKKERQDHPEKRGQERDFLSRFLDIKEDNPNTPDL
jgi:hypothetical protein